MSKINRADFSNLKNRFLLDSFKNCSDLVPKN